MARHALDTQLKVTDKNAAKVAKGIAHDLAELRAKKKKCSEVLCLVYVLRWEDMERVANTLEEATPKGWRVSIDRTRRFALEKEATAHEILLVLTYSLAKGGVA